MSQIQIETSIPIPEDGRGRGRKRYPFEAMKVGDSILMPVKQSSSSGPIREAGKKLGYRFTSRSEGDNATRVWRIE